MKSAFMFFLILSASISLTSQSYCLPSVTSAPTLLPTELYPTSPTFIENVVFQEGNKRPQIKIQPKESDELEENHIGADVDCWLMYGDTLYVISSLGAKWVRTGFWSGFYDQSQLTWQRVLREPGVYEVEPNADQRITELSNMGINIMLNLGSGMGLNVTGNDRAVWGDIGWGALGDNEPEWWFKTQEERNSYTDFARFMVRHFKGRVKYYEIWNEPNCGENPGDLRGGITLNDYRKLLKQVAVAIKQEDPEAKIVAGSVGRFTESNRAWLLGMLEDEVASLVDYVSFHPFYSESPYTDALFANTVKRYAYTDWKDYVSNVEAFKRQAASLGFNGGYMAEEMVWRVKRDGDWTSELASYTDIEAAKYTSRGIVMNLNLNFTMVSNQVPVYGYENSQPRHYIKRTLCTVMAGAKPNGLSMQVISEAKDLKTASFVLPNGDLLIALWNDVIAADSSVYEKTNVTINEVKSARSVIGIDTLNGLQQTLDADIEEGHLIISDLLVGDYPMILRISMHMETKFNAFVRVRVWVY